MKYDLIIIGSGPGGYKAALTSAFLGAKVAIIERDLPGGNCLNQGCIPTKSLAHVAELLEDISTMQGRGLIGTITADFGAAMAHKNKIVEQLRSHFPDWIKRLGVHIYQGHGRFCDSNTVAIEMADGQIEEIKADKIIIATGSAPIEHSVCKTDGIRILNSQDFMYRLKKLPRRLLCIGGGAIGTELGFIMHQFGSQVTIVEQSHRLLNRPGIPLRASAALERKFKKLGVSVKTHATVRAINQSKQDIEVTFEDGSQDRYDVILIAIGRRPISAQLDLEKAGVAVDPNGFIKVSQSLRTNRAGIFALGDVTDGPMTANAALHGAKIAARNAILGDNKSCNYHTVPTVIQSALQIATVGLSEDMAEDAGFEPEAARSNLMGSPKALAISETEGFTEITHDEETGQLLGGCIVGPDAGEQIQMLTAACQSDRGLWFFSDINYSHPSWCEELENAINPFTSEFGKNQQDTFQPGIYAAQSPTTGKF
ncbi:MAG: NAD(P)/FAD-dependent oxidoreductase [Thiohalomonadales bacterium]